jgi:hypothetical protein
MVTTKRNRTLLKRKPDFKTGPNLGPTCCDSPPCLGCLQLLGRTKIPKGIGLAMCSRKPTNQTPKKPKPKKTFWNFLRKFCAKNRDILLLLGLLVGIATLVFMVYVHFSSAKSSPQPRPRLEIEQSPFNVPVRPSEDEIPVSRPA